MDLGERYYQLSRLGRDTFCASVAQATLVRIANPAALALGTGSGITNLPVHTDCEGTDSSLNAGFAPESCDTGSALAGSALAGNALLAGPSFSMSPSAGQELLPLVKKLGTPFVDLITLGRTDGNDITLDDLSVSRFQAFFRRRHGRWFVCDAGSSNGTCVNGLRLSPRTEAEVTSHTEIRFGAVEFQFHTADSLYDVLAHRPSAQRHFDQQHADQRPSTGASQPV